jgi:non-ribosomal peptide synthetase component F
MMHRVRIKQLLLRNTGVSPSKCQGRVLLHCHHGIRYMSTKRPAFVKGPSEPPLLELTIPQHFRSVVQKHGDCTAVISRHQNRRLTYHELDLESDAIARGLLGQGVKKGDRCAVQLGNNIEFAVVGSKVQTKTEY